MKAASAKAKGKRLEAKVAAAYRHYDIDDTARPMPMSGAFTHFKGDVWKRQDYEYVDECKNSERVKLWEWWTQAVTQTLAPRIPILHISRNHSQILTVMKLETYMNLRAEIKQLRARIEELENDK